MSKPRYLMKQWQHQTSDDKYLKWYVVGIDIEPGTNSYLKVDGTWHNTVGCAWLTNTGTYFSTENEAYMALAKTRLLDTTGGRNRKGRVPSHQNS